MRLGGKQGSRRTKSDPVPLAVLSPEKRGQEKEGKEANASSEPRNSTQKVTRSATSPAVSASPAPPHRHHHPSHQQERERNKSQADHLLLGTGRSGALSSTEAPA